MVLFAVTAIIGLHHAAAAELCNRVVAVVNNEPITLRELNNKIKTLTGLQADELKDRNEEKFLKTRRQVLELLVDEKITRGKIRDLGITVTQSQIDSTIEKMKNDNQLTHEDLLAKLKERGKSYKEYQESIREDLERIQLLNYEVKSKIIIREEDVTAYYEEHKEKFAVIGKVQLASIFLSRKDPNDAKELRDLHQKGLDLLTKLRGGADFAEMAKKHSEGPGADEGGDLGIFKTKNLDPELKKLCESLPEGGISDLIVRPNGIQIIKLVKKREARTRSLDEAKDAVYNVLYRKEVNKRYLDWIKGLRAESYTKITF